MTDSQYFQPGDWLPIESAPKDTELLLAAEIDRPGNWQIMAGHFDSKSAKWMLRGARRRPTRWMPMPPTPDSHARKEP